MFSIRKPSGCTSEHCITFSKVTMCSTIKLHISPQVAQARNMSIGEHRHCCVTFKTRICMGKTPIVSVTYENERISIKNGLPYFKCVLRLSCVVHRPIYGRFMGFYVNCFLSIQRFVYIKTHKTDIKRP